MEIFLRETKNVDALVFMDLEATSFTSEMIEIGAYLAEINKDGSIKKVHAPFKRYVKAKHQVGFHVAQLTGITDEKLRNEGEDFPAVLSSFRKYVGKFWDSCRFVTFSEHDMVIMKNTMAQYRDLNPSYARNIYRHHLDLQRLLDRYIQDQNGNPYSLTNYLKVFGLEFDGKAHDAIYDALNLLDLYKVAREGKEIFIKEYKNVLCGAKTRPVVKEIIHMLSEGKTVTPEMFDALLEDTFK
ncbi:MAG: exonuclease domain-containing protein [Mollicutes bacterium]|nr:exonuclease domain-containing protein [Mollicutes bacterium]MDD7043487.1 exonuclease domain-containing protein [Mollicutes bacterium]